MKLCTLWFRLTRQKDGTDAFEFNHLEDGHCEGDKPTPKHPDHQAWARSKWQKKFAVLGTDGKIRDDFDGWKPGRELS